MKPLRIFVCSPYAGDVEKNTQQALAYCREIALTGHVPIAPHLYFTRFLSDAEPVEREMGLHYGRELLKACDEVWFFGSRISPGMQAELDLAWALGIPIRQAGGVVG